MSTDRTTVYEISVGGRLDARWSDWLGGMAITYEVGQDGLPVTTITGPIADQAALRGILWRLWDQNLRLISVTRIETRAAGGRSAPRAGVGRQGRNG